MTLPWIQHPLYASAVAFVAIFGAISFVLLLFISAPYGRHARRGWGPTINARLAWLVMEIPAPLGFAVVYFMSDNARHLAPLALLTLFMIHYVYRAFIFPFRMRGGHKQKPLFTVVLAVVFNVCNGATNAFAITELAPHLDSSWLVSPNFILGVLLFFTGYAINHHSDAILRNLRQPGESGYKIPYGGLYRWISSPNYFGELVEWTGFAIAAWTLPAWVFVFFTATNLLPRSLSNHRWYLENFENYPKTRRAILPYLL